MVMEYGGNVRVKLVPSPLTFSVTGIILAGSEMEFVSSGRSAFKTIAVPLAAIELPLISIFTGCGVPRLFTIFR